MDTDEVIIQTSGLTFKTALGPVFENADLTVKKGQVISVFGNEACGKTCFSLVLAGRMKFTDGAAKVAGLDLKKDYRKVRTASNISIIHRVNDVPANTKIRQILAAEMQLAGKKGSKSNVEEYLRKWDLYEFKDEKFNALPAYEAKLFDIALTCACDPKILFVDDIQTGLTQHQSIKLVKLFKDLAASEGMTILYNTIEYAIARYADGIALFSKVAAKQRLDYFADHGADEFLPVCGTANGVDRSMLGTLKPIKEGE